MLISASSSLCGTSAVPACVIYSLNCAQFFCKKAPNAALLFCLAPNLTPKMINQLKRYKWKQINFETATRGCWLPYTSQWIFTRMYITHTQFFYINILNIYIFFMPAPSQSFYRFSNFEGFFFVLFCFAFNIVLLFLSFQFIGDGGLRENIFSFPWSINTLLVIKWMIYFAPIYITYLHPFFSCSCEVCKTSVFMFYPSKWHLCQITSSSLKEIKLKCY